ncbi:MAG: hypothetical protein J2P37_31160 [Ktedonobacteraceae bacterium]|nr:hypothetical protein [Ktedonobacteraceae bacterium]MBO0795218.1 hypothetical protein [Ktedonobacteraceae bacterium]
MIEATNDPQKIGPALHWIVSLLNRHNITYQIVGGLAAKAYGASRPLVDIDIYVQLNNEQTLQALLEEVRPYVVREYGPHRSASWDIMYMALDYHGIYIDVADSAGARFYNHRDGRWEEQGIDYTRSTWQTLYGVEIAVMPREELLAYKAMLQREVDRQDLAEIGDQG